MRSLVKSFSLIIALFLLLSLIGCTASPEPAATTDPPIDGKAVYDSAATGLLEENDLRLHTISTRQFTVGKETFSLSEDLILTIQHGDNQALTALAEITTDYGVQKTAYRQLYHQGTMYTDIAENRFSSPMTGDAFLARYAPAALLSSSLYTDCTAVRKDNVIEITFSGATAAESWLDTQGLQLISATGFAQVENERLLSTAYTAQYILGNAIWKVTVTQTVQPDHREPITPPADTAAYRPMTYADAPVLTEQAFGLMLQATSVTSVTQEQLYCQAAAFQKNTQTYLNTFGPADSPMAQVEQAVSQQHFSAGGNTVTEQLLETFKDGKYTAISNGADPKPDDTVTAAVMREYCLNTLTENLLQLDYLTDATCTDLGNILLLEFTCDPSLSEAYRKELTYELFQDETYLDKLSSAYKTTDAGYYLAVDRYTGLPTALGIRYAGKHTINGTEYVLSMQTDQSIDLASQSAYKTLTGSIPGPEGQTSSPTPLFYRVTGLNGQRLWLLGTIHAGDDRTGNLPAEILQALLSADALAVECDTAAFTNALKNDPALQQQAAKAYYDTSLTAQKTIPEELYKRALAWMKATGSFSASTQSLRPAFWNQSIEQFYLRWSGGLSADKGVESRLLDIAHKQNIPVREVESALSQLQMLGGWSKELQLLLLENTLNKGPQSYAEGVEKLYELWCRGDADSLIKALRQDTASMTDAQKKIYAEYTKTMETDRNAHMLKVAKDYLKSGDTVFFVVGLLHLLGEDGLVAGLRSAGYTVEQVIYLP